MKLLPDKNPSVVFKLMSDGTAVLLSTKSETYYGLNPVGAQIWELLPPQLNTIDELCFALQERYPDVDPDMLGADVLELLEDLAKEELVHPREKEHEEHRAQADSA